MKTINAHSLIFASSSFTEKKGFWFAFFFPPRGSGKRIVETLQWGKVVLSPLSSLWLGIYPGVQDKG